jgi:hypothetical protein
MSSSPHANLPPRTSNHYPASNPSRREVAAHDPREMPKSSQNYPAPTKGLGYANRHGPEDTSSVFAGGISVNYRERETSIQVEEASYKLPLSANQYSTQSTYTKRQIQEAEGQVGQLLKDRGKQVSRQDFDKLVNEQLGRLYGSQQQQYHPTPLSSSQGGHKSPSSAVQHTQSMGPGGQNQCSAQAVQHRPRGARACLVGLFGRPGVSAFRIRKKGHWGGKNRIRLLKTL